MTLPRFFCPEISGSHAALDEAESRHATLSLRLQDGDSIELFDGRGTRARGRIEGGRAADRSIRRSKKSTNRDLSVRVEQRMSEPAPDRALTLIVAGCKGPRLDWLVEKCTELGVSRFDLARFERSVVVPGDGHVEKLRRVAIEACKQCGRSWLPEFASGLPVEVAYAAAAAAGAALIVADPANDAEPVGQLLSQAPAAAPRHMAAIVGPEGGLTASEIAAIREAGGVRVRLGAHILRTETAAVSIAAHWAAWA